MNPKAVLPLLNPELAGLDPLALDVLVERRTFARAVPVWSSQLSDFLYVTREVTGAKRLVAERLPLVADMTSRLVPLSDLTVLDVVAEAAEGKPSPEFFSALRQAGYTRAERAPGNEAGLVPTTIDVVLTGALGTGTSLHDLAETTGFEAGVFGSYFAKLGDLRRIDASLLPLVERLAAVARSAGEPTNAMNVLREYLPAVVYARLESQRMASP